MSDSVDIANRLAGKLGKPSTIVQKNSYLSAKFHGDQFS